MVRDFQLLGGVAAPIHDLGRPERFLNMLRVFKPTSPLSVGSWALASYGPLAGAAAVSELSGVAPLAGRVAGVGAAVLGPVLTTYTAALIADTAVPAPVSVQIVFTILYVRTIRGRAGPSTTALLGLRAVPRPVRGPGPLLRARRLAGPAPRRSCDRWLGT